MSQSIANLKVDGHHVLPEMARPATAKANLRNPEMDLKQAIGRAIQRAVAMVGWSNKEAAAKVGADDSQFGKWLSGNERPQFDRLFALKELRWPLIVTLSETVGVAKAVTSLKKVG